MYLIKLKGIAEIYQFAIWFFDFHRRWTDKLDKGRLNYFLCEDSYNTQIFMDLICPRRQDILDYIKENHS